MTSSLDTEIEINQEFLDFMQQKYKNEHPNEYKRDNPNEDSTLVSAPIFKRATRYEKYTFPELLDEMRVRKEPYFKNIYTWLYTCFGEEFEAYQKYK